MTATLSKLVLASTEASRRPQEMWMMGGQLPLGRFKFALCTLGIDAYVTGTAPHYRQDRKSDH